MHKNFGSAQKLWFIQVYFKIPYKFFSYFREKLILNVGGKIYPFTEKHLQRAPESRLSQLNEARVKQWVNKLLLEHCVTSFVHLDLQQCILQQYDL